MQTVERAYFASSTSFSVSPGNRFFLNAVSFWDRSLKASEAKSTKESFFELSLAKSEVFRDYLTFRTLIVLNSSATLVLADEVGFRVSGGVRTFIPLSDKFKLNARVGVGFCQNVASKRLYVLVNKTLPSYASLSLVNYVNTKLECNYYIGDFALVVGAEGLVCEDDLLSSSKSYYSGVYGGLRYMLPIGIPLEFVAAIDPVEGSSNLLFGLAEMF